MNWFRSWFAPVQIQRTESEAEALLQQISDILFPPLRVETASDGFTKYNVDHSVDSNLDAALYDLEEGHNDIVSQDTIRNASNKIYEVRKLLQVNQMLNEDAKYLIVDNIKDKEL